MDIAQILQVLSGAPTTIVVIYLLIREQAAHTETRKARDQDNRDAVMRYSELARTSAVATEATNEALRQIRDVLADISRLTNSIKA